MYIDFTTLYLRPCSAVVQILILPPHLQFSYHTILKTQLSVHPTVKTRKITSFSSWMEAWNVYLAICVDDMLSHAPSLVAYRCIKSSTNTIHLLDYWLDYIVQFLNTGRIQPYPAVGYPSSSSMAPGYNTSECTETKMMALSLFWCYKSLPWQLSILSLLFEADF